MREILIDTLLSQTQARRSHLETFKNSELEEMLDTVTFMKREGK